MGIGGLRAFLCEKLALSRRTYNLHDQTKPEIGELWWQELPEDAVLVVDASGFLFWVLQLIDVTKFALCGGDYELLDKTLSEHIEQLRKELGLRLIFVQDGTASKLKHGTMLKRLAQREAQWEALWNLCQHKKERSPAKARVGDPALNIPIPPLSSFQLQSTLDRLQVECFRAPGEADYTIAQICQERNKSEQRCRYFAYANDSDYMLMADCPYIELGDLTRLHNGKVAASVIWSRKCCAEMVRLTEAQLVEMALMVGNDFTDAFDRSKLIGVTLQEKPTIMEAISLAQGLQTSVLQSDDPLFAEALRYSRTFYNVTSSDDGIEEEWPDSLAELPVAVANTRAHQVHSLSPSQRTALLDWIRDIGDEDLLHSTASDLALHFLRDQLMTWEKEAGLTTPLFEDVNLEHVETLEEMLDQMDASKDANRIDVDTIEIPSWEDVLASNLYQLACVFIHRQATKLNVVPLLQPCESFSGPLFHMLMRMRTIKERVQDEDVEAEQVVFAPPSKAPAIEERLPIEDHRTTILETVSTNQVTIIHGETGCGKSTKLPVYLYEEAMARKKPCKMMLSQPRRIATHSLMTRLRGVLGTKIGMRMGNNTRDETRDTKIWLVTTGYLVQLMASAPDYLAARGFTHLVIDEVHERKLDSDILVFLARRVIARNPTLRLILMSATANFDLYVRYFMSLGSPPATLSVGAKRFPVEVLYLDDISRLAASAKPRVPVPAKMIELVEREFQGFKAQTPSGELLKKQIPLVRFLVRMLAEPGKAILIFVSGMQAITEIYDQLEEDSHRLMVFAIHSELPFEEQVAIFDPLEDPTMTKVIIATNAAESSITLPDVDLVICLGTEKAMTYDADHHGRRLAEVFISRSSAVQRAGRTGRVRPGRVVRLYPREQFELRMVDFEPAEVLRTPLDDSILQLRASFEHSTDFDGVIPLLQQLLQAPDLANVQRSFEMLYENQMISCADDSGDLTELGRLASKLPVDNLMARLIAQGICLGLGAEAVVLASAMTQPKTVFRTASRLIHTDPEELHGICRSSLLGAMRLDAEIHSEPIMMLQLYKLWHHIHSLKRWQFMQKLNLVGTRTKHFISATDSLLRSVISRNLKVDSSRVHDLQYLHLSPETVNRLRLLLVWNSNGALAHLHPGEFHKKKISVTVPQNAKDPSIKLTRPMIEKDMLPSSLEWRGRKLDWTLNAGPVVLQGCALRPELAEFLLEPEKFVGEVLFRLRRTGLPDYVAVVSKRKQIPTLLVACDASLPLCNKFQETFCREEETSYLEETAAVVKKRWVRLADTLQVQDGLARDFDMERLIAAASSMSLSSNLQEGEQQQRKKRKYALFVFEGGSSVPKPTSTAVWEFGKTVADSCFLCSVDAATFAIITMTNMDLPEVSEFFQMTVKRKVTRSQQGTTITVTPPAVETTEGFEFHDCPLDYKLLMTYKMMERRNKGVIRMKHPEQPDGEPVEVHYDVDVPRWKGVPLIRVDDDDVGDIGGGLSFQFGLSNKDAILLDANTVVSASVHVPLSGPSASLYAIAARSSMIGKSFCRFECVTMLPPGGEWMGKAMRCAGWSLSMNGRASRQKNKRRGVFESALEGGEWIEDEFQMIEEEDAEEVTEEDLCDRIRSTMRRRLIGGIKPCRELIAMIQQVFQPFESIAFKRDLDPVVMRYILPKSNRANGGSIDDEDDVLLEDGEKTEVVGEATSLTLQERLQQQHHRKSSTSDSKGGDPQKQQPQKKKNVLVPVSAVKVNTARRTGVAMAVPSETTETQQEKSVPVSAVKLNTARKTGPVSVKNNPSETAQSVPVPAVKLPGVGTTGLPSVVVNTDAPLETTQKVRTKEKTGETGPPMQTPVKVPTEKQTSRQIFKSVTLSANASSVQPFPYVDAPTRVVRTGGEGAIYSMLFGAPPPVDPFEDLPPLEPIRMTKKAAAYRKDKKAAAYRKDKKPLMTPTSVALPVPSPKPQTPSQMTANSNKTTKATLTATPMWAADTVSPVPSSSPGVDPVQNAKTPKSKKDKKKETKAKADQDDQVPPKKATPKPEQQTSQASTKKATPKPNQNLQTPSKKTTPRSKQTPQKKTSATALNPSSSSKNPQAESRSQRKEMKKGESSKEPKSTGLTISPRAFIAEARAEGIVSSVPDSFTSAWRQAVSQRTHDGEVASTTPLNLRYTGTPE